MKKLNWCRDEKKSWSDDRIKHKLWMNQPQLAVGHRLSLSFKASHGGGDVQRVTTAGCGRQHAVAKKGRDSAGRQSLRSQMGRR